MTDLERRRSSSNSEVYSQLLSSRENAVLFALLGSTCSALASAVVQVYEGTAEPSGQSTTWNLKDSGVVCLVQDKCMQSHFLRLYSVKRGKLLWEQELYTTFTYSARRPFFHTFPADDCQAALNFADEEEAERFRSAVEKQLQHIKDARHGALVTVVPSLRKHDKSTRNILLK
uniref:WH1 domain-containing protein n=1 Tax=Scleropages formosus TaxID=113540 RepID=A0A8C9S753_SCLFO